MIHLSYLLIYTVFINSVLMGVVCGFQCHQFSSVSQLCPTFCDPMDCMSSVQFSFSVVSNFLWPHGLQHSKPPCSSPTPRVHSNSCPWNRWCHLTISSSVIPFSSSLQSFPASGSFPVSQFSTSGGQCVGASASALVLPMNIQSRVDFL